MSPLPRRCWLLWLLMPCAVFAEAPLETQIHEARVLVHATEYQAAFELAEGALKRSREMDDVRLQAKSMLAMGFALGQSGAWQQSVLWHERALTLLESTEFIRDEGLVRVDLSAAYRAARRNDEADAQLEQAAQIFDRLEDRLGRSRVLSQRALAAIYAGEYSAAVGHGRAALALLGSQTDHERVFREMTALSAVSYALHQSGEHESALAEYDRLLKLAWGVNDQRQIHFALCNRAEIRWHQGEGRPVEDDLRRAIQGWEKAREQVTGTVEQRGEFLAVQVAAYDRLIRYLADTSRGSEAFEIAERFHARSFLEMLEDPRLRPRGAEVPELAQAHRRVVEELGTLRLELAEGSPREAEVRRRLADAETELRAIETRQMMARGDPVVSIEPPTLEQVQAGLEDGEVLVAYWLAEERIFAWTVTAESIALSQLLVSRVELEDQIARYLEPLHSGRRAEDLALRGQETEHLATGRQLYRWLIDSLPNRVQQARRLILVPDGILHYLPFEALPVGCEAASGAAIHAEYRACDFLGLRQPLVYSSSAGVLLSLRQRHARREPLEGRSELLALAPDFGPENAVPGQAVSPQVVAEWRRAFAERSFLRHTQEEIERIGQLFDGASLRLAGQATERQLKHEAGRYRLLHLATHGLVSDDLPMSSGLLLADGDGEDGLLQVHEVLGLDLSADLVTLSACRTGRGQLRRGEGIVGLSRAFLTVGASSVLVSLWDVDDRSTPLLMETFYREIASGVPAPEALLVARRRLFIEETEARLVFKTRPLAYAHPRFWASFVLIGGP